MVIGNYYMKYNIKYLTSNTKFPISNFKFPNFPIDILSSQQKPYLPEMLLQNKFLWGGWKCQY